MTAIYFHTFLHVCIRHPNPGSRFVFQQTLSPSMDREIKHFKFVCYRFQNKNLLREWINTNCEGRSLSDSLGSVNRFITFYEKVGLRKRKVSAFVMLFRTLILRSISGSAFKSSYQVQGSMDVIEMHHASFTTSSRQGPHVIVIYFYFWTCSDESYPSSRVWWASSLEG